MVVTLPPAPAVVIASAEKLVGKVTPVIEPTVPVTDPTAPVTEATACAALMVVPVRPCAVVGALMADQSIPT